MGILVFILLAAMLFFGGFISFLTRKWKPGGGYRTLFFVMGMTLPIIDVPYKYAALAYHCADYTDGIKVYKEFKPEGHVFINSHSMPGYLTLGADYIEWFDTKKNELWKLWRVNDEVKKERIDKATSKYEYEEWTMGKGWREYPILGVVKGVGERLFERSSGVMVAESYSYATTNSFGWFMGWLYEGINWGCSRTDAVSNNLQYRFRRLILGQD